ncbi:MAG: terminase small subunit [Clostridia bacterium]|nr:terminase small subunit [Clostridia bacterium]
MARKLTEKQKRWLFYYKQGKNATEAARLAGYVGKNENTFLHMGRQNLNALAQHIKDCEALFDQTEVASMQEINSFWTRVMNDSSQKTRDRLRASELRAKAAGGFIDHRQVEVKGESVVFISGDEDIAE